MRAVDVGKPLGRGQYWAKRALSASSKTTGVAAWLSVTVALGACWAVAMAFGGAGHVAPHWFYLPVIFAGIRFGPLAALATGVVAGVAAGPLLPLDVASGTAQTLPDWGTRAAFFVLIGQGVAFLVARSVADLAEELERLRMSEDLRRGLAHGEFHLLYQPVVQLGTGEVVGAEALLRWTPAGRPPVSPEVFIPVAEATGLIGELGAWVLRQACSQAASWRRSLPDGRRFSMSVNVSARQLADPEFPNVVADVLERCGLPAAALFLEVTETALIDDLDRSVAALEALKALGVGLAIDDFGTGQSSLSYAHRFPVDVIKVDRSFTAEIEHQANSAAVTAGVINLAHGLGMRALAEGIETAGQVTLLRSMGCDLGQGYYFDRPEDAVVVGARLAMAANA